jgi:thiamine-phosphate pyrophosphorylase
MQHDLTTARFYGILDAGYVSPDKWFSKAKDLIAGGAGIVQIRAKGHSRDEIRVLTKEVWHLFKDGPIPLIINDDLELALEFEGAGLHVGQDDMDAREARKALGPDRVLGLSTHSIEQAREAIELADILTYFAVGPVFPTQTKPTYTPVGLNLVEQVANEANNPLPWFCIGGINRKNAQQVKDAGGQRLVAVSDVLCDEDTPAAVQEYLELYK